MQILLLQNFSTCFGCHALVVYQRLRRSKGLSPRAQNLKKGGAWGAVGPKSQKWAKAPAAKVKK